MFLSLFNHSCDPNVESFVAKDNKVIIYSKQPIKQGSQVISLASGTFLYNLILIIIIFLVICSILGF